MPEDWKDWVYKLLRPLDDKMTELSNVQSEHKMALKILGISLVVAGTAIGTLIVGLIATAFKVWGNFG